MENGSGVVVSLASLPGRLGSLAPVLAALGQQTLAAERIHLWLCPFYPRLEESFSLDRVPAAVAQRAEVELVEDWGPITKLYPALQRYGTSSKVLVVLDDDRLVPPDFLATLVASCRQTGAVCGFRGRRLSPGSLRYRDTELVSSQPCWCPYPEACPSWRTAEHERFSSCAPPDRGWRLTAPVPVDILTGTGGLAFPPGALLDDFWNTWQTHSARHDAEQRLVDDIWINGYLARQGVPRLVVPTLSAIRTHTYRQSDSLARVNVASDANDRSLAVFADCWS